MPSGQRTGSLSTRRTELPTRLAPTEYPGRYVSDCTTGAARSLTSTTVILVVAAPPDGQGKRLAMQAETSAVCAQISEKTTAWLPSRNIDDGHPSICSLPATARSCGGQLLAENSVCPERTRMRVPSFLTKSASS